MCRAIINKFMREIHMCIKKTVAKALSVLAATIVTCTLFAGDVVAHGPASIEGVWRVSRHGVNCATGEEVSTFPALMTFHADGTVSGQAVPPGSTSAYGPAEFGVWHRNEHSQGFSFRLLSYNYDDTGVIAGSIEVTGTAELTSANAFAYKASIEFYDANGNLLSSRCGKATGLRF
jgi:hypothetical protein